MGQTQDRKKPKLRCSTTSLENEVGAKWQGLDFNSETTPNLVQFVPPPQYDCFLKFTQIQYKEK